MLPRFLARDELEEYTLNLQRKEEARRLYTKATTYASLGIKQSKHKPTPQPTSEGQDQKTPSGPQANKYYSNHHIVNLMKCLIKDPEHPEADFTDEVVLETNHKKQQTNSCLKGVKIFSKYFVL